MEMKFIHLLFPLGSVQVCNDLVSVFEQLLCHVSVFCFIGLRVLLPVSSMLFRREVHIKIGVRAVEAA